MDMEFLTTAAALKVLIGAGNIAALIAIALVLRNTAWVSRALWNWKDDLTDREISLRKRQNKVAARERAISAKEAEPPRVIMSAPRLMQ